MIALDGSATSESTPPEVAETLGSKRGAIAIQNQISLESPIHR